LEPLMALGSYRTCWSRPTLRQVSPGLRIAAIGSSALAAKASAQSWLSLRVSKNLSWEVGMTPTLSIELQLAPLTGGSFRVRSAHVCAAGNVALGGHLARRAVGRLDVVVPKASVTDK
jgi:hypothetical protein